MRTEKNVRWNLGDREQERTLIFSCRELIHGLSSQGRCSLTGIFFFLQGEVGAPGGQGPPGPVGNAGPSGITLIGVRREVLHTKQGYAVFG